MLDITLHPRTANLEHLLEDAQSELDYYERQHAKHAEGFAGEKDPAYWLAWSEQTFTDMARLKAIRYYTAFLEALEELSEEERTDALEKFASDYISRVVRLTALGGTSTSFAQNAMNKAHLEAQSWIVQKLIVCGP